MYIQIRTIDGKQSTVVTVSKLTTVEELKAKVFESLSVEPSKQRLFYRGKQMEDGYKIFDYNINLNDVVQLLIKIDLKLFDIQGKDSTIPSSSKEVAGKSEYFKVGDVVAAIDSANGAWAEGKIVSIMQQSREEITSPRKSDSSLDDGLIYGVQLKNDLVFSKLGEVRPVSKYKYKFEELKIGDIVLVNYNLETPSELGSWYDFLIEFLGRRTNGAKNIWGTIYMGKEKIPVEYVRLEFCDEIFKIEKPKRLADDKGRSVEQVTELCDEPDRTSQGDEEVTESNSAEQTNFSSLGRGPSCLRCKDRASVKCKECGCHICGLKDDPDKQLMCDECDMAYHLRCLDPPLETIPNDEDWYCPLCKNDENEIVKAGEKLKESKKKSKMASNLSNSSRDWGKGMACVGRTKECTIVPPNHYGPIPGVEVGTCWKFRLQVSESGVHRPHVAGIHGRETDGAYSIVLSGGYEDDIDDGESFMYTGSGGRDLSGNKRTAEQSSDQKLTRMNKALAMNCNARLNPNGAKAENWKAGKPIRVVRNYKLGKYSKYAPEEGNRYDGIYKVVEYYPEKGKSGFIVWRYKLCRDDPSPAPWTSEGKKLIKSLGLSVIYPEGYLEAMAKKEKDEDTSERKKRKRVLEETSPSPRKNKRLKLQTFKVEEDLQELIKLDVANEKLWNACEKYLSEGKQKFISSVSETFMCICCQELVYEPVTTDCNHNFCRSCLKRSFKAEVYTCPYCRCNLGEKFKFPLNKNLGEALLKLFPGYNVGR
ncbi:E3 ubiquitin-protein ligase UHRF1 [Anabrus simplex]|uniref:E3 ubiquitin-protein ligase UHRF1 n=1 Tax=Anabrus simplex TaxID=316456 RepID=UPI0035A3D063